MTPAEAMAGGAMRTRVNRLATVARMGGYYTIAGREFWVEDRAGWTARSGSAPLLVLHGGLDHSAGMLTALDDTLRKTHRLIAFDRSGHGRSPYAVGCFDYADMASQVIDFIEGYVGEPVHVLGSSDGAVCALITAMRRPDLLTTMVLGGANFHHSGLLPGSIPPRADLASSYAASHAGSLAPEGPEQAAANAEATWDMWQSSPALSTSDLRSVETPALVVVGDDEPIDLHHSVDLYTALPLAQFAVLPGTSHAALHEKPRLYAHLVSEFLGSPRNPDTLQPVRRSPRPT